MRKSETNNIERVFVGWEKPLLWSLVDWLKSKTKSSFDYSNFIIITPSKRAQARIAELLSGDGRLNNRSILAPKFYSNLSLALTNYTSHKGKSPITITESLIVWNECIKNFIENKNESDSPISSHLVPYLEKLRKELVSHNLNIGEITRLSSDLLSTSQQDLLVELEHVERIYIETLNKYNLYDNILDQEISVPKSKILLVGFHKISPLEISLIEKLNLEIYNIIGAPEQLEDTFSADGSMQVDSWKEKPTPVPVNIASNSYTEIDFIKAIIGKSPKNTTLTILEETLIGPLQTSLIGDQINILALGSKPFTNSLWGSWVLALLDLYEERAEKLKAFFTHPLTNRTADESEISEKLDHLITKKALELESLKDVYEVIVKDNKTEFLTKFPYLETPLERSSTLASFSRLLLEKLSTRLETEDTVENPEEVLIISKELNALIESPLKDYTLSIKDYTQILRDRFINLDSTHLEENSIPIIGWQETYLDDACTLIVSDCVEGNLPEYPPSDPILTDSIKARLGLPVRDYFLARDNFLLHHLKQSREKTLFLASKENLEGDFNKLSKLFLNGLDEELLLRTLSKFYDGRKSTSKQAKSSRNAKSVLPLPPETPYNNFPLESLHLSPSQIKDYINCPYHFYLRHILKLSLEDYSPEELPPYMNGQLLHNVFAKVGASILSQAPKSKEELLNRANHILDRSLSSYLRNKNKEIIYQIQGSLLKSKLNDYVDYEWDFINKKPLEIHTEIEAKDFLTINLSNNETINLRGRIDRVEIFDDHIQIVDFKTGDTELKISQCHKGGEWIDPQLPLYGIYVRECFKEHANKPIKLKLHNFSSSDTKAYTHELTDIDIEKVTETAKSVAQSILNSEFYPPKIIDSPIIKRLAGNFGVAL